jgi:FkbM family methyltransferase
MRATLDRVLCRFPRLYSRLLLARRSPNLEKVLFLRLLGAGETVFDIGANAGYYTLLFSQVVGPRGRVHAFEPIPPTFALLAQRLAAGKSFDNVVVNPRALAAEAGTRQLFVPGQDLGQASLARHEGGSWSSATTITEYSCQVETLDSYAHAQRVTAVGFVKVDVEGAELFVLRGGGATLRACSPLLYVEVCADWTVDLGYQPTEVVRFLRGLGYDRFYLLQHGLRRLADPEAALAPEGLQGSANLLCGISARHGALLRRALAPLPGERS